MKKGLIVVLVLVLIVGIVLALTTCGKKTEEPTKEITVTEAPKPTEAPKASEAPKPAEPAPAAYADALDEIQKLIDAGEYYPAAQAVAACRETYPEAGAECDALWQKIKEAVADRRPETGERERTFRYQGGNRVEISSASGDVDLTVTGQDGQGSARYYVREGESVSFYLPCYRFNVAYKVGDIWFDDEIGFGEFCEENSDSLAFRYAEQPGWVIFHFAEGDPAVQVTGDRIVPSA